MASTQGFPSIEASQLASTLADPRGALLQTAEEYRRYRAGVFIGTMEHGQRGSYGRSIFYEVGFRHAGARDALAPRSEHAIPIDCSLDINAVEAANFEGYARRFSNFSPQWQKMDLAGMVERLAKGVAAASLYGNMGTVNLIAGQPTRVTALGTLDSPQTASIDSVFIPRTVDTVGNDHVFAVLAAAANGEGAAVTTDVLRLDANTNQPIIPSVVGPAFATACVEALRILGANFESSGGGDVFAYALTRGIHSCVSVVAHTDEGGFMRNLFRHAAFRTPYGGVNQSLRAFPSLPALAGTANTAVAAWVDAIALKTAAAVAHCDPLVPGPGGLFPTVFTSADGPISPAGTPEGEPTDADARAIGRQISADLGRFAPLYMRALGQIVGTRTVSGVAESHFCTVASLALDQGGGMVDRHLRHKTVAPYFWIEPTSLIPRDFLDSPAEHAGYASKVTPGHVAHEPCFEKFALLERGTTANHATVAFKMRSARTSALICAYAGDPAVLADIKLYQFDEDSVVLAGDQGPTAGPVPVKHAAADPISSYLWRRGQSCFPAPAEFINTNSNYGAKVSLITWDNDFNATVPDLPHEHEMAHESISFRVTRPTGLPTGPSNYEDREARRARSRAAIALAQATVRARAFGGAASPTMAVSNVPPSFGESDTTYRDTDYSEYRADPGTTTGRGIGGNVGGAGTSRGAPLPPTAHHEPQRAPRLPPQGPLGGGPGGGAAPPPQGGAGVPPPAAAPPTGPNPPAGVLDERQLDPLPAPHIPGAFDREGNNNEQAAGAQPAPAQ
ncbi:coat protein [Magnaporthe oryzae virus 2]|uniref:Coat protein n=1 Tax=Magnaporthe oryzae virus 2 TaxID=441999 RepID=A9ZNC8_9VIRU|nr:coat protein [Magnaporthe oryzae virus 2]BAF98177.1 coat protein [Magnaporthe oryzae virus 2]